MRCSLPRPTRCGSSTALLLLALFSCVAPRALTAQQDEALVGVLAGLLAAADARRWDEGVVREGLQHADPAVRRQAVLAAGRIGDPAALDLLVAALRDSSPAVQGAAAFALGLLREQRALPALGDLVRAVTADAQSSPQEEAVTAIAKIGGDEGARALGEILQTASPGAAPLPPAASRALFESWRLGPRAPVPALVSFAHAPDGAARQRSVYALARLRATGGAGALVAALQDRDPAIRALAARGLSAALADSARLDRGSVVSGLRSLLADRDAGVRINALRALASFRDSALSGAVTPLVADADVGVAVQAETTLGALGGAAAVAALAPRAAIGAGPFALRRQAVIGLAEADSAAGVGAAAGLARDPDWRWRRVAAEAFTAARARAQLEDLLADADGRVAAEALQGLQRVVPDSEAALAERARVLLAHADPAVRSVAADVLARQPDAADVERLIAAYARAAGDEFNDARLSAVGALAAIARESAAGRLAVAEQFVARVGRSEDYLVRRLAADRLPDAAAAWGPVAPIATGRTEADYRDVARRYLLPMLAGQPAPTVTIDTERGSLVVRLLPLDAPLTVATFLGLVERRFFDGGRWHRVVPNFVVQDGDPREDGWGGPGFVVRDEVNPTRYESGTMGMALSGPDTGGSQFFITHSPQPHLDGTYTVFGQVTRGVDMLGQIAQGDRIRSIRR